CGLQFTYPVKAMDYDQAYQGDYQGLFNYTACFRYDIVYKHVEKDEAKEREKWKRVPRFNVFLPLLSLLPKGKLLDIGCSTGNFLLIAKSFGFEVYGTEASKEACKIGTSRYGLKIANVLTLKELPADFKGPYKVITAFEVIEHVEEPLKFLREIYEHLEEGGFAILSCPPYFKFENLALGYRKYKWWYNDYPPHHLNRFKPWTLYYALKLASFEEVVVFTEPLLPGTVLEGVTPQEAIIPLQNNQQLTLPKGVVTSIILESLKPLYVNARYLGNFLYAIGVKGKSGLNWEKILRRAIGVSAVEFLWSDHRR
ncbi:MAG: class I SAM-dependent methyltransferase, partial [Caldimicrobium sp.]|nr:class I SAM-dependent methyltransferase [Caldimicrobium sp.]